MPTFNRRTLRQRLGRDFLHDTIVGQTSGSWGTQAGSLNIIDTSQADPTASGEQLYHRHWMRLLGSGTVANTSYQLQDLRVGSFNTGSGAYLAAVTAATTIYSGMPFEVSALISPADKDRAIDAVIQDVRIQQEFPLWSIPQGHVYSVGTNVVDVLDVRYFSDPTSSLDKGEHQMDWWKFETTATGQQLRVQPSLYASYQLIVDAILEATLGAGDLATVNLLSDEQVLWGAAARCFWMLEQQAPGQEAGQYKVRRQEAAKEYSRLSQRFSPKVTRRILLDTPF